MNSWKEIAKYLSVEVRTAQRWAKELDLPVYRRDESQKTFVYAYENELDKWFKRHYKKKNSTKASIPYMKKGLIIIPILIFLFTIILFFHDKRSRRLSPNPFNFAVIESQLLVFNNAGEELWRYDTKVDLDPSQYVKEGNFKSSKHVNFITEDIDKDNNTEVIFVVQDINNSKGRILTFNKNGKLLWSFEPGKSVQYEDQEISKDFDIGLVRLEDLNNDGFNEIIVVASHKMHFPSRVSIMNHNGHLIGDYWNSGHLLCVDFLDLDNDGNDEIILGGLNINYQKACLVVLDSRKISGRSPVERGTRYYSEELEPGTEKYYILIPQNDIGRHFIYDVISGIDLYSNKRFQISTSRSRVFYEFDHQLRLTYILCGDQFDFVYNELAREGKISVPLSNIKEKIFKSEILYFNGKIWTNTPTMTDFWKKFNKSNH